MATETTVTVWGMNLEEEAVKPFSEALRSLGFPGLELVTDGANAGGTRIGQFHAWSACFRSTNEAGNRFPVEHFVSWFSDMVVQHELEGGIIIDDDPSGDTHTIIRPMTGSQLNPNALEFGIIHIKE